jgi:hypothetical protein
VFFRAQVKSEEIRYNYLYLLSLPGFVKSTRNTVTNAKITNKNKHLQCYTQTPNNGMGNKKSQIKTNTYKNVTGVTCAF